MQIARTIAEARAFRTESGAPVGGNLSTGTLGFVPTMGALHAGHLSLVAAARTANQVVAASIFVNPTQFSPNEDFSKYPRAFDADCALLEQAGVALLFAPAPGEMYPAGFAIAIDVGPVATRLDGASRPGHFTGVATVVAKLLNIVTPTRAYFGQKDAAQVAVLRQLVRDLSLPVELVICPTVREPDGLALSSRNRYLSTQERAHALVLSRALLAAEDQARHGVSEAEVLLETAAVVLAQEPVFRLDYCALVDPDTLEAIAHVAAGNPALLAIAGWIGNTRLIDNTLLNLR
jgi:pantoate--beta-alanine ligase